MSWSHWPPPEIFPRASVPYQLVFLSRALNPNAFDFQCISFASDQRDKYERENSGYSVQCNSDIRPEIEFVFHVHCSCSCFMFAQVISSDMLDLTYLFVSSLLIKMDEWVAVEMPSQAWLLRTTELRCPAPLWETMKLCVGSVTADKDTESYLSVCVRIQFATNNNDSLAPIKLICFQL